MKFKLNLIREAEADRLTRESSRKKIGVIVGAAYAILAIVICYSVFDVLSMRNQVAEERKRLESVKAEYQRYKASSMIVNKSDVELLSMLQNNRIFWTKKLLVMARYLPADYWITQFGFDRQALTVEGYGYISDKQEQLITLHDYLNALRNDRSFSDVFRPTYLNSTVRKDDERARKRVSFSYTGVLGRQP
jgi:hypothetical protein